MNSSILADTSSLVSLIMPDDHLHSWAISIFKDITHPVVSCEPVITETTFLLRNSPSALTALNGLIRNDFLQLSFSLKTEWDCVYSLQKKYSGAPMSLADACLVRMSELFPKSRVWTADSDFKFYKKNGRAVIPLIFPVT